jgi:hypothetical protein
MCVYVRDRQTEKKKTYSARSPSWRTIPTRAAIATPSNTASESSLRAVRYNWGLASISSLRSSYRTSGIFQQHSNATPPPAPFSFPFLHSDVLLLLSVRHWLFPSSLLPFLLLLLLLLLLISFLLLKPFPRLSFRPERQKFHLHNAELQKYGIVWKFFSDCGSKPAVETSFFLCTPTPLAFVAHFLVHPHPPPRELSRAQAIAGPPYLSLSLSLSSVKKSVRVKEDALFNKRSVKTYLTSPKRAVSHCTEQLTFYPTRATTLQV